MGSGSDRLFDGALWLGVGCDASDRGRLRSSDEVASGGLLHCGGVAGLAGSVCHIGVFFVSQMIRKTSQDSQPEIEMRSAVSVE